MLCRFGFPPTIVHSLATLFFTTELRLNINGFLSLPVRQRRGLRQGDPISPILFNLAFEPLLQSLLRDSSFPGLVLPCSQLAFRDHPHLQAVKLLAYADDIFCIVDSPAALDVLFSRLAVYSEASNAKVNYHKTVALSLSGFSIASSPM